MNKTRAALLISILLSCSSLFARDAQTTIREMVKTMEEGVAAGDVNRTVAMYAGDAILMPPNEPAVVGIAAIRQWWGGMLGMGKAKLAINVDDLTVSGSLAVERGHWDLDLMPNGATAAVKDHGKYIVVWKKRNGKWHAVNDIFNSDVPQAK